VTLRNNPRDGHELLVGHEGKERQRPETFHALEHERLWESEEIGEQPKGARDARRNLTKQRVADVHEHPTAITGGDQPPALNLCSWFVEAFLRVSRRLVQVVPLTLVFVAVLLYWSGRSVAKTGLVLLAVPFSAIGAIWSLYLLGYPMSPAVWVGLIALMGVDAETGMFMVLYLDLAWQKAVKDGRMRTPADLRQAVLAGAVRRIRPKFMTVATMFFGLVPILWSTGAGSEVMKRIAAPIVGGLAMSFLMELIVYPLLYERWKSRTLLGASPHPS
jgi:hypothetical protein